MKQLNLLLTLMLFSRFAFPNSYSVPVMGELNEHAQWEEISSKARLSGNRLIVDYDLPQDLVGTKLGTLHFEGIKTNDPFIPVKGQNVRGVCMTALEKPITCILHYPRTIVDEVTRNESLLKHFTGNDLDLRTKVARVFGADPAGLLKVTLEESNKP